MRKPRDYDAELTALDDKARRLRDRKLVQLGELVVATGADALAIEILAGALVAARATSDTTTKEAWKEHGAAFFQKKARATAAGIGDNKVGAEASEGDAKPATTKPGLL